MSNGLWLYLSKMTFILTISSYNQTLNYVLDYLSTLRLYLILEHILDKARILEVYFIAYNDKRYTIYTVYCTIYSVHVHI